MAGEPTRSDIYRLCGIDHSSWTEGLRMRAVCDSLVNDDKYRNKPPDLVQRLYLRLLDCEKRSADEGLGLGLDKSKKSKLLDIKEVKEGDRKALLIEHERGELKLFL
jgi:hypothetical protein